MLRIVILVFALASGGFAGWLALRATEQPAAAPALTAVPEKAPAREVLVANADIGSGAVLEEAHLRWQPWEGEVPAVFISRSARPQAPETLKGSVVRGGFVAGEPIRDDRLAQPGSGFLSGLLPSGKRAVAVRVTAESTAGGFILPNDRVDVIHTSVRSSQSGGQGEVSSRAILANVRVLAVDQTASEGANGTAVIGKTATLEVDPDQIPIIAAAEASGSVSLALSAAADKDDDASIVNEKTRKVVVRVFAGNKLTSIEVPSSPSGGS